MKSASSLCWTSLRSVQSVIFTICIPRRFLRCASLNTSSELRRFAVTPRDKLYCNAQMAPRHIRTFCELSADCERLLERAMLQQSLTARAHDRILKVARTIADLEGVGGLEPKHIAEAIQYRTLDRTFWA